MKNINIDITDLFSFSNINSEANSFLIGLGFYSFCLISRGIFDIPKEDANIFLSRFDHLDNQFCRFINSIFSRPDADEGLSSESKTEISPES
jgi:hypothetical protein